MFAVNWKRDENGEKYVGFFLFVCFLKFGGVIFGSERATLGVEGLTVLVTLSCFKQNNVYASVSWVVI